MRACTKKPLVVKLSPNAENITEMALACEEAGADGLSLVNTFQAMAIDLASRRPVFQNIFAGLSGPAIRPIALRMVYQVCRAVHVPVVGLGGIATGEDALAFIMAGAAAVQVGTASFCKPARLRGRGPRHGRMDGRKRRENAGGNTRRGTVSRPPEQKGRRDMSDKLDILKETGAFLEGHFLLSSGRHSNAYCQMAKLQQYPDKAAQVLAPVAEKLKRNEYRRGGGPGHGRHCVCI